MSEHRPAPERRPRTPPVAVSNATTESNRTGSWKYLRPVYRDLVAPCIAGCPTGVDVEGYMALLRDGRVDDACDLILRENPIPAVTGRVCNRPCEDHCSRGRFDGAVAIHAVERALGDRVLAAPLPDPTPRRHAETVAVVGSGPAGLACAYHLVRLGYGVEVLEQAPEPGGMLRYGIPAYRLPREVLDREIERLEALGVVFRCDARLGAPKDWSRLAASRDAVVVATGAQLGRRLGVPGEELPGVWQGLEFLRAVNRGERPGIGRRAVVVGGGNTAMDCARTALRLGASALVVYRRGREEMPAITAEVVEAEREGVEFVFMASPASFEAKDGRLDGVACARMRLGEPDASGRRRPIPTGEAPLRVPADAVLLAIGEDVAWDGLPPRLGDGGAVRVDDWGATADAAVFAAGDVAGEERTVATALGAGKRAAIGVDRYLRGRRGEAGRAGDGAWLRVGEHGAPSMTRWRGDDPVRRVAPGNAVVQFDELNLAHFARADRHPDRYANGSGLAERFGEVNLGLAADAWLAEAGRCFECGVCNGCELCMIFCADVAIRRGRDGARFEIDLDHCKGCGVCAAECPRGAIAMTREGV